MKNTEVIKALRCCADGGCFEGCPRLALVEDALECRERLMTDAADALEAAEQQIVELEEQIPKKGEWIILDPKNFIEMCSRCRYTDYTAMRPHYCPSCGAKMKEKQKTESKNIKSPLEYDYCGTPKHRYNIEAQDRRTNNE